MKILVCNAGSTSLKFKLFDMPEEKVLARAGVERVGNPDGGLFWFKAGDLDYRNEKERVPEYRPGIRKFLDLLLQSGVIGSLEEIGAIGLKTVLSMGHLGVHVIDDDVIEGMKKGMVTAPAHNTAYLSAIATIREILPDTTLVGVFETAFHQTIPPENYLYPVPYEWYEKYGVRKMGYHGASHGYVASQLTKVLGPEYRAVSCHLGGSCSLCALKDGKSFDTSFGMSLQVGLPQNNRAGDIDPYLIFYMVKACGMTLDQVEQALTKKSGLLGISGVSTDLRDISKAAAEGNERAVLAEKMFLKDLVRYIGGYAAELGGVDAVAFTAGIGENSKEVRAQVMKKLAFLGVEPEPAVDLGEAVPVTPEVSRLTAESSKVKMFVIPANEELGVARKTYEKITD